MFLYFLTGFGARKGFCSSQTNFFAGVGARRGFFHEKAKEYGFDYLDILASFQGMTKNERQLLYLPEDGHYSALGHSYLKSILTDWIAAAVES